MYDETADSYSEMMDREIELPVYADILGRLKVGLFFCGVGILSIVDVYKKKIG